ncbi:MAG: alkaline phosphatase D family protein [Planctomycetota bacterium]|jgi:alkaline phosphatase D
MMLMAILMVGFACAGEQPAERIGSHLTFQPLPHETITRIAIGSCAFQWDEQLIWDAVIAAEPDLFLYVGDAIYGDFDGEKVYDVSRESLLREWGVLAAVPSFQRLAANVPVMAVWDNHDYGRAEGGAEFALKDMSKRIFLDFFGYPAEARVRDHSGIYHAKVFGPAGRRVQIIMLDTRYNKGPYVLAERPEGAGGSLGKFAPQTDTTVTLLGEEQWTWLEQQLREPAEVRFVVSSSQIVADQKGMDEWGNYPHERRRLFDLIESTDANGVVLLSGNVHYTEVSQTDEGPYLLTDFTASGLTHVNRGYADAANRYRVAGPYVDRNVGLVEIDWEEGPTMTLRAIGSDGQTHLDHVLALEDLRIE